MAVIFESGYSLPGGDRPLTNARIAHAKNWLTGAIAASSTDASETYAAESPANSFTFDRWKPASLPATWSITPAGSAQVDYCVIAAHNFASAGVEFSIELDLGAGFVSVGLDGLTVSDARPIFLIFEPRTVIAARVSFLASGGIPIAGVIRFGSALQMEERSRYPGRTPFELAERKIMSGQRSVTGEFIGRVEISAGMDLGFSWSHLSEVWCNQHLPSFIEALEADLFVIAERPDTHPNDVALCWISGQAPQPTASGAMDLHNFSIQAEAYVNNG